MAIFFAVPLQPQSFQGYGVVRGVAQPGSALVWGARGRKFESCLPDERKTSGEARGFLIQKKGCSHSLFFELKNQAREASRVFVQSPTSQRSPKAILSRRRQSYLNQPNKLTVSR